MINRKGMLRVLISAVFLLCIMPLTIHASVPQMINYQSRLIEDGVPVTGFRMITFSIWDNDIGGDPGSGLWNETQTVEVTEGIYNVELGSNTALPANLYDYNDLFLQVDILHPTEGWQRLSPLMAFDSTMFAIKAAKAEDADTLDGKDSTELDQSVHVGDTNNPHSVTAAQTGAAALSDITWGNLSNIPAGFADNVDNEGIATETDPTVTSSVKDGVSWGELSGIPSGFADNVDNEGVTTETDPTVASSVKDGVSWSELSGIPSGFADNVDDNSGGDITGVNAGIGLSGGGTSGTVTLDVDIPFSLTGNVWLTGVISASNTSEENGYGLYGIAAGLYGTGVYGWASDTGYGPNYGGYFKAEGESSYGVFGFASNTGDVKNYGGFFRANGSSGIGVSGSASSTVGPNYGGYFTANGSSGMGVYGEATGNSGSGVYGANYGSSGNGVYGVSYVYSGYGVYGEAAGTCTMAVYGRASNSEAAGSYGGYFIAEAISGVGISGIASGRTGRGVYGAATNTGDGENYGGYFYTNGDSGRGVYGHATSVANVTNYGGYFEAEGASGIGVYGEASDTGNVRKYGGYFKANGSSGFGVSGRSEGTYGVGVYGWTSGIWGKGVEGYAAGASGRAVYGFASNTGDVENYGGYFRADGQNGIGVCGSSGSRGVVGYGNQYDFYAGGSGTNYGPFTGAHEVRFAEDIPDEVRPGMIVSVTGRTETRKKDNEDISLSSTLPTVTLTGKAMDKAVLGVLVSEGPLPKDHWYESQEGERFGVVNALGEGRMWVTNINGSIEAGDYITSSDIPGYGQMQNDDFLHSYTLGKAIETVDWGSVAETVEYNGVSYKIYLIAVVYTSG